MNEIIAGSIGGLVGALAAAWLYAAQARKQRKADTLRRFVANRFDLAGAEFSQALNEAIVVFADNRSVIRALDAFRGALMELKARPTSYFVPYGF